MRLTISAAVFAASLTFAANLFGAPAIETTDGTIGRNLQSFINLRLTEPVPAGGLVMTVTSDDPERLLLSTSPELMGKGSLQLKLEPRWRESQDIWLQARGDHGTVTYTATAPGYGTSKGTITLAPSAILIVGPYRAPSFRTTTGADPSKLVVYSAQLDSSGRYVATQPVAGGQPVVVDLTSSNPQVGKLSKSQVQIPAATSETGLTFIPAAEGTTTLAVSVPPGFTKAAESESLDAVVSVPGLGLNNELIIGKDLQVGTILALGEAAPKGGLQVTITSSDPKRLLVAPSGREIGKASLTLTIPAGELQGRFVLQALGGSGAVEYSASAPGYRGSTESVTLTPSGVVIMFGPYGPPDEAEVLRPHEEHPVLGFEARLGAAQPPSKVVVWMERLDPVSRRGADITVQPLRAGLTVRVPILNSDPAIGVVVPDAAVLAGGNDSFVVEFKPLKAGKTTLSVKPPAGFTEASNSTTIPVTVR